MRLIAKVPTLSALIYRHGKGLPANKPDTSLDYVSRFLKQTFESADGQYDLNPDVVKALDLLFILHADHEQNASTSTVRRSVRPVPTRTRRSLRASPRCGVRPTAVPTKPC